MHILRLQKVNGIYRYPEVTRKVNCDGSVTYFVKISNRGNAEDYFIGMWKIPASEETPEEIAKNISILTYDIMNQAERTIDKSTGLKFIKLQIDRYREELAFQE